VLNGCRRPDAEAADPRLRVARRFRQRADIVGATGKSRDTPCGKLGQHLCGGRRGQPGGGRWLGAGGPEGRGVGGGADRVAGGQNRTHCPAERRATGEARRAAIGGLTGHSDDQGRCPTGEQPHTPPGQLGAAGKRLPTVLQAVETVQPSLHDFYNSLGDDRRGALQQYGPATFCCRAVN